MMSFEKFCKDCPKRRENEETRRAHCEIAGGCLCEEDECTSYHVYRKVIKTVETLVGHCHYHERRVDGLNVTWPVRKVAFGGDKE